MRLRRSAIAALFALAAGCGGSDDETAVATTEPAAVDGEPAPTATFDPNRPLPDRPLELGDANSIEPLDASTLIVDPDTIVFDTFDGRSVTLADADPDVVRGLLDAIAPIDAPDYEPADAATWLGDDDIVIGYVDDGGNAWAYAIRILNFHEIVNDRFADVPVLISYCPLCGSGVVFDRRLDGRTLSFSNTSALHENDMVMVDRESGSYWHQVPGRGLGGDFAGRELTVLPSRTATWADWRAAHPDTQVMSRPPNRTYGRDPFVGYVERVEQGRTPFPVSEGVLNDGRLSPGTTVVVATIGDETRAWPVTPERTLTDRVGDVEVTVTLDGTGGTVVDAAGDELPTRTSLWFAIVASFPEATVGP